MEVSLWPKWVWVCEGVQLCELGLVRASKCMHLRIFICEYHVQYTSMRMCSKICEIDNFSMRIGFRYLEALPGGSGLRVAKA